MDKPTVGGWTQSYCTTCKKMNEHVVVAMIGDAPAKVECTSCHKQHQFRAAPPGVKEKKPPKVRAAAARPRRSNVGMPTPVAPVDLATRVGGRTGQKYDPQQRYSNNDVVEHPSFGTGVVVALSGAGRLEVMFPAGTKILTHDRGGHKSSLMRPSPRNDEAGPRVSDAPPPKTR